jgi:cell wall-associated NlpC family hydrolase
LTSLLYRKSFFIGGETVINYNKYIGVKYVFNGRDINTGLDCLGLLQQFYKDQGWKEDFDDGSPIEADWYETDKYRFARYMITHFDRVKSIDELDESDVILFEINGESHVAIWVGFGKFLSTFPKMGLFNGGVSFMDRIKYYPQLKITGLFKRRK